MGLLVLTRGAVRRVAKGDVVLIPIKALNRLESLWGPDAHEFRYVSLSLFLPLCLAPALPLLSPPAENRTTDRSPLLPARP